MYALGINQDALVQLDLNATKVPSACIISGSKDRTIRLWDTYTGGVISRPFIGHEGSVNSAVFSPDGTRIISDSGNSSIRMWDIQTAAIVAGPFEGHAAPVNSVAFSLDGTRIVSGSGSRFSSESLQIRVLSLDQPENPSGIFTDSWRFNTGGWVTIEGAPCFWTPQDLYKFLP